MGKICKQCGEALESDAKFCQNCGTKCDEEIKRKYCTHCGAEIPIGSSTCTSCGKSVGGEALDFDKMLHQGKKAASEATQYAKKGMGKVSQTINEKMGETGNVKIHLYDLISEVFKKHTKEEQDEIFSCGTSSTTPKENEIASTWPKPWLYSRVFVSLVTVTVLLYLLLTIFNNELAFPGLMFMGAMAVPFSIMIFFWEVNAPRNISFYQVLLVFFIGGVLSLFCTLLIFQITGLGGSLDYFGAMCVGVIEELGKVLVVAYYIKKLDSKYTLNGLLIGSCVGAGFAVFETAGYIFRLFVFYGGSFEQMTHLIFLRGALSVGGHVAWAAISGAALVAVKYDKKFEYSMLTNGRFLFFFALVAILHGLWDCPLVIVNDNVKLIILCVVAWIVILSQIASGLKQINRLSES